MVNRPRKLTIVRIEIVELRNEQINIREIGTRKNLFSWKKFTIQLFFPWRRHSTWPTAHISERNLAWNTELIMNHRIAKSNLWISNNMLYILSLFIFIWDSMQCSFATRAQRTAECHLNSRSAQFFFSRLCLIVWRLAHTAFALEFKLDRLHNCYLESFEDHNEFLTIEN